MGRASRTKRLRRSTISRYDAPYEPTETEMLYEYSIGIHSNLEYESIPCGIRDVLHVVRKDRYGVELCLCGLI